MVDTAITAPTESFIADLYANDDMQEALFSIPEVFIQQARDAAESFFIDNTLLSRQAYARENGECDLLRIVVEDPKLVEAGVVVKFRLSGIINTESGELRPMISGKEMADVETWLRGFRSTAVIFTPESVTAGIISQADYDALENYAQLWADICDEEGSEEAMYTTEHARKRLWLVASNKDALFTFDMVTRQNPNTGAPVIGITNIAFADLHIIGAGVTQVPSDLNKASGVTYSKSTVNLPKLKRTEGKIPAVRRRK